MISSLKNMMRTTSLKQLLNIRLPVIPAPMAGASGGLLAANTSAAGTLGFMGQGKLDFMKEQIDLARKNGSGAKIGIGYQCFKLDQMKEKDALEVVDLVDDPLIKAVWFAFGDDLYKWVDYVAAKSNPPKIFVQVSTKTEIEEAFQVGKAIDVLCIQGNESGGHGSSEGQPVRELLSYANDIRKESNNKPLLLAAGGVGTAQDVKDLLNQDGCSGVVAGTRFVASVESLYSDVRKQRLVAGQPEQTHRSKAFDSILAVLGWPEHVDARGFNLPLLEEYESGKITLEEAKDKYKNLDETQNILWSGLGVGSIKEVKPAKDILMELCSLVE